VEPQVLPSSDAAVDIYVGVYSFAALSDGTVIGNHRFFREEEKALARAQRKLSKGAKGNHERAKRRKVVSRIHERIANLRNDFIRQVSLEIVTCTGPSASRTWRSPTWSIITVWLKTLRTRPGPGSSINSPAKLKAPAV